ncbi:DUF3307 domain-containing protein [Devosia chinhatensis]|uniref:DUF3307 domain-containing protein n=1 Tax=Devosia chinhatensis TaxID=429727 RepID=A0A0F5FIB7_9HYPH|nr:DUF3307 domain-containing protein [Devosia chinhatensis]KKB08629.1 hypothetical protein VE26_00585 [Devosia chinhatensis]
MTTGLPFLDLFALMVFAHALGDYPLQGEFLSRAKNRANPVPGVPWYQALAAHSIIQGGLVGLITGSLWLGLAETVVHALIDDAKCTGKLTFNQDQALHIACKLAWIAILIFLAGF